MPISNKLARSGFDMLNKQQLLNNLNELTQDKVMITQYPAAYNFLLKNIELSMKRCTNHS
jgi:hypothetical protein